MISTATHMASGELRAIALRECSTASDGWRSKARMQSPTALVHQAAQAFSAAALGPEGVEGTTAFLQKRKARWVPQ